MAVYENFVKYVSYPLVCRYEGLKNVYRYLKELEEQQYFPQEKLQEIQWMKLKNILHSSYANTTYYRKKFDEYGIHPRDIKDPSDMIRVPILTKEDIIKSKDQIVSKKYPMNSLVPSYSGGTSGIKVSFYYAQDSLAFKRAATVRCEKWTGWDIGGETVLIWPANQDHNNNLSVKEKIKGQLYTRWIMCPAAKLDDQIIREYIQTIIRKRPSLIRAFPTPLNLLAEYVLRNGINIPQCCNIISTGEPIFRPQRERIEKAFGGKVFDSYGAREVSLIGQECELHNGYHINMECNYLEFIKDGKHAKPGEVSDMVITDLVNHGMPLIRYGIDDQGIPSERTCMCGRGLALFESIVGRDNDVLKSTHGGNVFPSALIMFMIEEGPEIGKMRIIQDKADHLKIQLTNDPKPTENHFAFYLRIIKNLFGDDMKVDFELLNDIHNERSGKFRFTKYEVK